MPDTRPAKYHGKVRIRNVYIQSATRNGKPYSRNYIRHEDIMNDSILRFEMSSRLATGRGTGEEGMPFSLSSPNKFYRNR